MPLHCIKINHIIFVLALKAKGRPPKDYEITEDMKINELKYIIVRKDSKIKRLEKENKLNLMLFQWSRCLEIINMC